MSKPARRENINVALPVTCADNRRPRERGDPILAHRVALKQIHGSRKWGPRIREDDEKIRVPVTGRLFFLRGAGQQPASLVSGAGARRMRVAAPSNNMAAFQNTANKRKRQRCAAVSMSHNGDL